MANKAWKSFERRVAAYWGSVRNALSGGNSKLTRSDSLHPTLFISCKLTARSPFWRLWREEKPKAEAEGKKTILALGSKNCEGHIVAFHCNDSRAFVTAWLQARGHRDLAKELNRRSKLKRQV